MTLKHFGNQILLRGLKLAALAAICGSLASADVLYWIDFELASGVNAIPGGIAQAGLTGVAATNADDFDLQLTTGSWTAVIIGLQGFDLSNYNPNILPDLTNYVNGGGKLIGTDWASTDTGFYALFQADIVDTNNTSVTNDGSALFNAIAGNIDVFNPGWGTFDQSYSALAGATGFGPSGGGFGIIEGNNGRTFLNGPLSDAYSNVAQGQQLIANELTAGTEPARVPEPGTFALLVGAVGGLALARRRKQIS